MAKSKKKSHTKVEDSLPLFAQMQNGPFIQHTTTETSKNLGPPKTKF